MLLPDLFKKKIVSFPDANLSLSESSSIKSQYTQVVSSAVGTEILEPTQNLADW